MGQIMITKEGFSGRGSFTTTELNP